MYSVKVFVVSILIFACEIGCGPIFLDNDSNNSSHQIVDYYWREYTGIIPGDAIPGGIDASGHATYIGQMYHSEFGVVPATIRSGSIIAISSGGGAPITAEKFVKILCSRNHSKYQWVRTKNEETHLLTTCHLVIGGSQAGYAIIIGRVRHELDTIIGKVFPHRSPSRGLYIPYDKVVTIYQSYEILTYDCNFKACTSENEIHCL